MPGLLLTIYLKAPSISFCILVRGYGPVLFHFSVQPFYPKCTAPSYYSPLRPFQRGPVSPLPFHRSLTLSIRRICTFHLLLAEKRRKDDKIRKIEWRRKKRKGRRYTSSVLFRYLFTDREREKKERCLNVLEEIIAVTF